MKIFLIDINQSMCQEWSKQFSDYLNNDVVIIHDEFLNFMNKHGELIDCIVSPANSFGLMTGGLDLAINTYYKNNGIDIQTIVQTEILNKYYGEQPLASPLFISVNNNPALIHCPTMRTPREILDPEIVYQCMRNVLMCALNTNKIESILIPAFGGLTGKIDQIYIAKYMLSAYEQIKNPPSELNWKYALDHKYLFSSKT